MTATEGMGLRSSIVGSISRSSGRRLPNVTPSARPRPAPSARPPNALTSVSRVAPASEPSASAPSNALATWEGGAIESLGP